jgi:hypothetical protein
MGLRDELRRVRASLRGELESFDLEGGAKRWYDPYAVGAELFLHGCACLRAGAPENRPEPPEILLALAKARDRRAAFAAVAPNPALFPYEREAFVERGELVHRSLVAGRDADESAPSDLSEPGP